jgi:hypothetical protein
MPESDPATVPLPVLVLVRDLIFASRIGAEAKARNVRVQMLRDPAALAGCSGDRLIVDLNQDGAIDAAANWKRRTDGEIVGFVSHVDAPTAARARAANIDHVLARSAFVQRLPELLLGGPHDPPSPLNPSPDPPTDD